MFRSIGAIVTGFVVIAVLALGANLLLVQLMPTAFDAAGRAASTNILLLSLAYVAVFAVFGCYLTARLAPSDPMRHALLLGALGFVFNILGSLAQWETVPVWYHAVALTMVMPYAWIGGRLREIELTRRAGKASGQVVARV